MPEIKYPEMTKKISTPKKPPGKMPGNAWNSKTGKTAMARMPVMSDRHKWFLASVSTGGGLLIRISRWKFGFIIPLFNWRDKNCSL